jgi:hypothetical protein
MLKRCLILSIVSTPVWTLHQISSSISEWASQLISSLLDWADCRFHGNEYLFMLKLEGTTRGISPRWAFYFDKMKGIIREPRLLMVEIPQKRTKLSVQEWYDSKNPLLRFIDSIYVCRKASNLVDQESFSDILDGYEG